MKNNSNKFEYIDLFSGCGGLALGMHNANWKAMFAVEKNIDAFSTLAYNLIDRNNHFNWPKWLPVTTIDINDLIVEYKKQLSDLKGKVTLVAGGPPCQGFSTAGKRIQNDERNKLVDSYINFISIVTPDSVLFENVRGFDQEFSKSNSKKKIKYSTKIINSLKKLGYNVEFKMINFSDYGIPQRRVRFILFASKTIDPNMFFSLLEQNVRDFLDNKNLTHKVSVKSAISDLEAQNGRVTCPDSPRFYSGVYGKARTKYQRYCRNGRRKGQIPNSHRFARHRSETIERFSHLLEMGNTDKNISNVLENEYGIKKNCFSVLASNLPSPTLTSNPDDHIHYSEPRTLSVREYARIQSFPDWFEFKGKYTTGGECRKIDVPRYTQVGNAIPPLFAEQVGLTLIQILKRRK